MKKSLFFLITFYIFGVVLSCKSMETNNEFLKKVKTLSNCVTGKHYFWHDHGEAIIKLLDDNIIALLDKTNKQVGWVDTNVQYVIEKNKEYQYYNIGLLDEDLSVDDCFNVHPNGKEIFWTKKQILKSYNIATKEQKDNILFFDKFFPSVQTEVLRSFVQAIRFDSNNDPVLCLSVEFKDKCKSDWTRVNSVIKGKDYSLEYKNGSTALFYGKKLCVCEYEGNVSIYNFNDKKTPQLIQRLKIPNQTSEFLKVYDYNKITYATVSFDGLVTILARGEHWEKNNIFILNLNDNKYTFTSFFQDNDFLQKNTLKFPFFCIANSVLAINCTQKNEPFNDSMIAFVDVKNLKFIDIKTFFAKSEHDKTVLESVFPDGKNMIISSLKRDDKFRIIKEYTIYELPEKVQEYIDLKK